MDADIYRVVKGQAKAGSGGSVIMDRGYLQKAAKGEAGFIFSEAGIGPKDLAIVGPKDGVLNWLMQRKDDKIVNTIGELPDIYMTVDEYVPGQRFSGYFPLGDALAALAGNAAGFIPLPDGPGMLSGEKDAKDAITSLNFEASVSKAKATVGAKAKKATKDLHVLFSYIKHSDQSFKIGTKEAPFLVVLAALQTAVA